MATMLGTAFRLETSLRVDPRLVVAARVMELAAVELDAAIDAEIAENPALERTEGQEVLLPMVMTYEGGDREAQRCRPSDDVLPDFTERVVAQTSMRDTVRASLLARLPRELLFLGDYLVGSLDSRGFLTESDEEIALATNSSLEEVAETVAALQACEPAGVGARGVREGLVIMLRREGTPIAHLAARMLEEALEDFLARRTARLARRFLALPEEVEQAYAIVRTQNPAPFGDEEHESVPAAEPDLALVRTEAGWMVEVAGPALGSVFTNRTYLRQRRRLAAMPNAPAEEKRHVETYVERAERFVSALESRRDTLRRLGEALLETQAGFVTTGDVRFLQPLTRAALAARIGVHESTLSRATADKFVRIGTGEVVPFSMFFAPALRVQRLIDEIVANENPAHPLSDQRIADMLAERGVKVARRTVNKYRTRTRTLSSRGRRDPVS